MIKNIFSAVFGLFKRAFLPDKKDLIGSLLISIPLYIILGLGLIVLLPLIIICVVFVFLVRRLWKILLIYLTYRLFKRKVKGTVSELRRMMK